MSTLQHKVATVWVAGLVWVALDSLIWNQSINQSINSRDFVRMWVTTLVLDVATLALRSWPHVSQCMHVLTHPQPFHDYVTSQIVYALACHCCTCFIMGNCIICTVDVVYWCIDMCIFFFFSNHEFCWKAAFTLAAKNAQWSQGTHIGSSRRTTTARGWGLGSTNPLEYSAYQHLQTPEQRSIPHSLKQLN